MSELKVGDKVRALKTVTESGEGEGDPKAQFPDPNYIHATRGDTGKVVHTEPGYLPTVMFDRRGTATIVKSEEVELWPQTS